MARTASTMSARYGNANTTCSWPWRSLRSSTLLAGSTSRTVRPRYRPGTLAPMSWLASVDGTVTPVGEARIPVTDEGLLRGDGGFEVLRVYGGRPFALDDHFARHGRTCAGLRLETDLDALREEALALVERAAEPESLLRLVVTRRAPPIPIVEPPPPPPPTAPR